MKSAHMQGLDIGPDSLKFFQGALADAKTVIWNGPMGVFEFAAFAKGTYGVAETLAELTPKVGSLFYYKVTTWGNLKVIDSVEVSQLPFCCLTGLSLSSRQHRLTAASVVFVCSYYTEAPGSTHL